MLGSEQGESRCPGSGTRRSRSFKNSARRRPGWPRARDGRWGAQARGATEQTYLPLAQGVQHVRAAQRAGQRAPAPEAVPWSAPNTPGLPSIERTNCLIASFRSGESCWTGLEWCETARAATDRSWRIATPGSTPAARRARRRLPPAACHPATGALQSRRFRQIPCPEVPA